MKAPKCRVCGKAEWDHSCGLESATIAIEERRRASVQLDTPPVSNGADELATVLPSLRVSTPSGNSMPKSDPTAAQRARRRRERAKAGIRVISLEITADQIAALEAQGLIDEARSSDRNHIAFGISWLLDGLCVDAVAVDYDQLVEQVPVEGKLAAAG